MGGNNSSCRRNPDTVRKSSVVVGIDSTFYEFVPENAMGKHKRGHPKGQILIQIHSFEKEALNKRLGELRVKVVSNQTLLQHDLH